MAPKKPTGTKKLKTGASTSRAAQPFDSDRFSCPVQFERYKALQRRKIWAGKLFSITPDGKYNSFIEAIDDRSWGTLINPPHSINVELV
ncbi:hypothetical protein A2U01_0076084, partial [Trifolium medium]|nr:hypothetical protein [Trifolium medium]